MSQKNDTRGNCYKNMKSARNIDRWVNILKIFLILKLTLKITI